MMETKGPEGVERRGLHPNKPALERSGPWEDFSGLKAPPQRTSSQEMEETLRRFCRMGTGGGC